jgi:hypothetical protein
MLNWWSQKVGNSEKNCCEAYRRQYESQRNKRVASLAQSINEGWHADERAYYAKERKYQKFNTILTVIAVGAAISTVVFSNESVVEARKATKAALDSVKETKRQADIARDQFALTYPPVIKVNNFLIWEKGHQDNDAPLKLKKGMQIDGRVWVYNPRSESANITESFCKIYWVRGHLPLWRQYTKEKHSISEELHPVKSEVSNIPNAGSAYWDVTTKVESGKNLYIMGYVIYRDRFGTVHSTYFARRYDERNRRFVKATDNPDYESEE